MTEDPPTPHPFETEGGRAILRDLHDAVDPAQWHEAVARLVALLSVSATGWRPSDQALILWSLRVEDFIAAGPKIIGRKPDVVQARQDAMRLRYLLGDGAPRSAAADLFMHQERARVAACEPDLDRQAKRARDNAGKRVDRAVEFGGARVTRRPKRK